MNRPAFTTLSVVIPAYNEERTLPLVLDQVRRVELRGGIQKEVIIVDDCSGDDTGAAVRRYQAAHPDFNLRYYKHAVNRGKGAALHTGIRRATGQYVVIQDADLEYNPGEYNLLLQPVLDGRADVVYGSRFTGCTAHRTGFFWQPIGNKFLTFLSNLGTNLKLTDMETGCKLFNAAALRGLHLREKRFGFEPEVTAKIARVPNIRIHEVGISYRGRTYAEGKKINWKDGFRAVYCIMKYGFFRVR